MDLGKELNLGEPATPVSAEGGGKKITYPCLYVNDKPASEFITEHEPKIGDEFAATVRMRVSGLRANAPDAEGKVSHSIDFDVIELDDIANEESEEHEAAETPAKEESEKAERKAAGAKLPADEDDEDDEEVKALGYKRPKTEKETPSMKAADLAD